MALQANSSKNYFLLYFWGLLCFISLNAYAQEKQSSEAHVNYIGESFSNIKGGRERSTNYKGLLDVNATLNLEKILGVKRTQAYTNVLLVHGNSISDAIGDDLLVSNIQALTGFRLQNLWLQYTFKDDSSLVRIGKQAVDDEFLTTEISNLFLHGIAAYPFTLSQNYPQWPVASLALFSSVSFKNSWMLKSGIYQAGLEVTDEIINNNGLDFSLNPSGYLFVAEVSKSHKNNFVRFGAMYDTNTFENSANETRKGVSMVYFAMDKQISSTENTDGWYLFASGSVSLNPNFSTFDYDLRTGLLFKHKVFEKPADIALGFFYPHLGNGVTKAIPTRVFTEQFAELTYFVECKEWWQLQASVQQIFNPGGASLSSLPDATIIAFRTYFSF